MARQPDLFAPPPRAGYETAPQALESVMDCYQFGTVSADEVARCLGQAASAGRISRAELKRLMTPLPRITAAD